MLLPLLAITGAGLSAHGHLSEGDADKESAYARAAQLRENAGQEIAAGQQAGEEEQRRARLAISRMIAVAASSGASAVDPTVVKLASGVAGEGALAAGTQRFNAESGARSKRIEADSTEREGRARQRASRWKAAGSLLAGGYAAFGK